MNLLAKTQDGWFLTATEDEVYRLLALYGPSVTGAPTLAPGREIQVNPVFEAVHVAAYMVGTKYGGGLAGMSEQLKKTAWALDVIGSLLQPLESAAKPVK